MRIKIIETQSEYDEALLFLDSIMTKGNSASAVELEQMELVSHLIADYENKVLGESLPEPIEAIRFIMEQEGLTNDDLVPFIGSKSKVSEVLSGKRQLSLNMMRALRDGLGMSEKILLNQAGIKVDQNEVEDVPVREMIKRGYIEVRHGEKNDSILQKIATFMNSLVSVPEISTLFRKTTNIRTSKRFSNGALKAWLIRVINKAEEHSLIVYDPAKLTSDFMKKLVKLSSSVDAINKVVKELENIGIFVVVEPHMPRTYVDGASIMLKGHNPIIGLTIRYDRLDNFWFTILHELAHIKLHSELESIVYVDDVEASNTNKIESEADALASEVMIPDALWGNSPVSILPTEEAVLSLASELGIHPAIVAGKTRYVNKNFRILNGIVGSGEVRKNFNNINWK